MSLLTIIKLKIYSNLSKIKMFRKAQHKRNLKQVLVKRHKAAGKDAGLIKTKNGPLFVSYNEKTKEVYVAFAEFDGYEKTYDDVPLLKNNEFCSYKIYSAKTELKH